MSDSERHQPGPIVRRPELLLLVPALCMALLVAAIASAQPVSSPDREQIHALISRGALPQLRRPDFADFRPALDDFYRSGGYAPQWLAGSAAWRTGLAELASAPSHGLDTVDYDVEWLDAELRAIAAGDRTPERVARADVALTVSFFRLLSDLHRGRVSPERAGFKFSPGDKRLDFAALLQGGIATGRLHEVVASAEPSFPPTGASKKPWRATVCSPPRPYCRCRNCPPARTKSRPARSMPASAR